MDRKRKKELLKQWAQQQRDAARAALPLEPNAMQGLFDWLDRALPDFGCDHSQRLTIAWLEEHSHPVEKVLDWLNVNGGRCDCEVLANAEEQFDFAMSTPDSRGTKH
jgi:hypothetical protein